MKPEKIDYWCCNGNAEDCALCTNPNPDYPWLCTGHPRTPENEAKVSRYAREKTEPEPGKVWSVMYRYEPTGAMSGIVRTPPDQLLRQIETAIQTDGMLYLLQEDGSGGAFPARRLIDVAINAVENS